jgi:hypothetical protein
MMEPLKEWTADEVTASQKVTDAWEEYFQAEGEIDRAEEFEETAHIAEVQDKHEAELLALENVVGVAAGLKEKAGKPTKTWSLTVFVEQKQPKTQVPKASLVPGDVEGVPTDVVEVGIIEALPFIPRVRPARPGYSIGHKDITAGTFGCLVRDIRRCCCNLEKDCGCSPAREECPGDYLILSNNHVLANLNEGEPGDLILQPGAFDGGVFPSDGIATLERFEPIQLSSFRQPPGYNLVDAAVARPLTSRDVTASIIGLLMPRGIDQALVGMEVIKVGRTTQVTTGRVLNVNATIVCNYGGHRHNGGPLGEVKFAQFRHQIITTAMASPGDSGSLLMDSLNLNAMGLLYCGSPFITIHNHIADVETALGVRPLTAPRPS